MIHNFDTFHSKYFDSLIYYFLRISPQTIVQLDKIIVVTVKPFTFPTIDLHDFSVQIIDLLLKTLYPILLIANNVSMLLRHILLVLLDFLDLILKFGAIIKQHRLHQIFNLNGQNLL